MFNIDEIDTWDNIENRLEPKTKPPLENIACPNP